MSCNCANDPFIITKGYTFDDLDLTFEQGPVGGPLTPLILTGALVEFIVWETLGVGTPLLVATSLDGSGRVAVTPLAGRVAIVLDPEDTEELTWTKAVGEVAITFADGRRRRMMLVQLRVKV